MKAQQQDLPGKDKETGISAEQNVKANVDFNDGTVAGLKQTRAVCSIEGLDRPTEMGTLKGPLGRYASVRIGDPANLPHLRIGDTVLVTYTEALAVALEEAAKPSARTQ